MHCPRNKNNKSRLKQTSKKKERAEAAAENPPEKVRGPHFQAKKHPKSHLKPSSFVITRSPNTAAPQVSRGPFLYLKRTNSLVPLMFQQVVVAARQDSSREAQYPKLRHRGQRFRRRLLQIRSLGLRFLFFSTCFFFSFFVFFFFHPLSGTVPHQASPGVGGEPLLGEEGHGLIGGSEPLAGDPLGHRHPLG